MNNPPSLLKKVPFITTTLLLIISFWLSARAAGNYLFLMTGQFTDSIPTFVLFGNPLNPSIYGLIVITLVSIYANLFSTKEPFYQSPYWRVLISLQMYIGIIFYYTWMVTAPIYNKIVPFYMDRVVELENTMQPIWYALLIGNPDNLMIFVMFIPTIIVILLLFWLGGHYVTHSERIKEVFFEYEYKSRFLQKFFSLGKEEKGPDVILGPDSKTKELIIQPGKDRTLNNIIIGSIGTGKTAALVLPILNQDLHWMTKYINRFPEERLRTDFETEEVKGQFLTGISVIEPSNDLCQKTFKLVEAHGIPAESVFYIDPTDPKTPNINPMQGPVDQVAETFTMVIEGLAERGNSANFFFQQAERNHLKHYIYLLKLHDQEHEATFDMLLDMYNNAQLVKRMHEKLKETIPVSINAIENRDERNHWKIVQQVAKWFDQNLLLKTDQNGFPEVGKHDEERGKSLYYDAKEDYVQGLRNILNDIGANKLLRRVLFGPSQFNFDKHMEGGVLLVNTAKGELGNLSNVLGKLILLSLQNAVFRREPNKSSYHHILVDEFPDYLYRPFKEFPAQSRKYKTIVTVVAQTVSQISDRYGESYMQSLLGTFRHKIVYGDIPSDDAQLFSSIFGEKESFEETQSEQIVSPLQEAPSMRSGSSYSKKREAILSSTDLIFQKPFQAAVKIVENNRSMPVRQINAEFVPKKEFEKAAIVVEREAAEVWLKEREQVVSNVKRLENKEDQMERDGQGQENKETKKILDSKEEANPNSVVIFPSIFDEEHVKNQEQVTEEGKHSETEASLSEGSEQTMLEVFSMKEFGIAEEREREGHYPEVKDSNTFAVNPMESQQEVKGEFASKEKQETDKETKTNILREEEETISLSYLLDKEEGVQRKTGISQLTNEEEELMNKMREAFQGKQR